MPYKEIPGNPFIKRIFIISKPKSLKLINTYTNLPVINPAINEINNPSKTSSSLQDVSRISFHRRKMAQKKERTRNTPKVYIFIEPIENKIGSIFKV